MGTFFIFGESTKWRHFSLVENLLNGRHYFVGGESTKWRHFSLV